MPLTILSLHTACEAVNKTLFIFHSFFVFANNYPSFVPCHFKLVLQVLSSFDCYGPNTCRIPVYLIYFNI